MMRPTLFNKAARARHVVCASASVRRKSSSSFRPPPPPTPNKNIRTFVVAGTNTGWDHTSKLEQRSASHVDFRPHRIILLRHGESLGNVDESAYVSTADWRIPLTDKGRRQASEAGSNLRNIIGADGEVFFYHSPYLRTTQTLEEIEKYFHDDQIISVREEPRISEQQIGNFQNVEQVLDAKAERRQFGRFYYRFPSGEAGLDVYSRVSSFISTLVRDCYQYSHAGYDLDNMNVVIVTHGLALRLFLMRWFQFSVEEFEMSENPENAQLVTMVKKLGEGGHKWFELEEEDRMKLHLPECCGVPKNVQMHELRGVHEGLARQL